MRARIREKFKFEAAHSVVMNGQFEEFHGHTYGLEIFVEGNIREGYVMDFLELRAIVEKEVLIPLDHKNLNKLFKNPTTENIALWIAERLRDKLPTGVRLYKLVLWEGNDNGVELEF